MPYDFLDFIFICSSLHLVKNNITTQQFEYSRLHWSYNPLQNRFQGGFARNYCCGKAFSRNLHLHVASKKRLCFRGNDISRFKTISICKLWPYDWRKPCSSKKWFDINHQHETVRSSVKNWQNSENLTRFWAIIFSRILFKTDLCICLLGFIFKRILQLNQPIPFQHKAHEYESPGTQTQGSCIGHNISLTTNSQGTNGCTLRVYQWYLAGLL